MLMPLTTMDTLLSGRFDADELAIAYLNPPKSNGEGPRSDAMKVGATPCSTMN